MYFVVLLFLFVVFFFKQKTAYEMRISDWSSDVCSSDLRVQSAGGAVYLRANEPIEPTRLQLQDADTGELILLDIAAHPANDGEPALEPVQIVEGSAPPQRYGQQVAGNETGEQTAPTKPSRRETPVSVVLTRHAAQNLYAPLRRSEEHTSELQSLMRISYA